MLKRFLKGGDIGSILSAERLMILVVASLVAVLITSQVLSTRAHHRDDIRQTDLFELQLAVQQYYAVNGFYPISLQVLSGLPAGACTDPKFGGDCANSKYGYIPLAVTAQPNINDHANCDDQKILCQDYVLFSRSMEAASNPFVLTSI